MVGFHRLPRGKVKKADGFWRHAAGPKILAPLTSRRGDGLRESREGATNDAAALEKGRTWLSQVKEAAPVGDERRGEDFILIVNIWRCC